MTDRVIGPVLVNGTKVDPSDAAVSVFDIGFQRGYGCFEAMRCYEGSAFRAKRHLERLGRSAQMLGIPLPEQAVLEEWTNEVAGSHDGVLRVYVTGGTDPAKLGTDNSIIMFLQPLPEVPSRFRLDIVEAPWHPDGRDSELTGAKTLSYGPNLAATIAARARGFDDAVLLGRNGAVLEGPTFSLGWVEGGVVHTPSLDSNILESVTREATFDVAVDLGIEIREGVYDAADLLGADEVFIMSTVREISHVVAVGEAVFEPGPVTTRLAAGFHALVERESS